MILLDSTGLAASRPGRQLFADLDLTISTGDRLGLVGINGCGKSTLLGVLAGTSTPEAGTVRRGRGVNVAVLDQDPVLHGVTMRDALHAGQPAREWEVEAVADRLGLGDMFDTPVTELSGGLAKRVALARALVADAEVLILDEPTNHLDIDAIAWLEDRLAAFSGALVLVTHDRHFLDRVTTRILELDRGAAHVHEGGYESYMEHRARHAEHEEAAEAKRRNLARAELAWLRRGAPARTSKPKARIAIGDRARGDGGRRRRRGRVSSRCTTPRRGWATGSSNCMVSGIGFGDNELFSDVELSLDPRERLGIVGANGSGKSTLLDIMAGRRTPSSGTVEHGTTVSVGVYDQTGVGPRSERCACATRSSAPTESQTGPTRR